MAISQIPALTTHISFLLWKLILGRPSVADPPPIKWQFHRFLLWQLIFHSNSESSYWAGHQMAISQIPALTAHISFELWELILGRPGGANLHPPIKWTFHRFLIWQHIFHSYSESSYLAEQVWQIYPSHQMAISQIPDLTAHISFLLWELIFGRPGVANLPLPSNGNFTDSCSDSSYLIPSLTADIRQTKCWQIYLLPNKCICMNCMFHMGSY